MKWEKYMKKIKSLCENKYKKFKELNTLKEKFNSNIDVLET